MGLLNPLGGEIHKKGMYLDRWTKQKIGNRKKRLARKGRRRARLERRRKVKIRQIVARARSRTGELNVVTWNVRSLSLTGRRGTDNAEVLLQKCKVLGCDVIGRRENRGGLNLPRQANACSVAEWTGAVVGLDSIG